ncbi:hypothetical protein ACOMHN_047762 [Nucella lapillus]
MVLGKKEEQEDEQTAVLTHWNPVSFLGRVQWSLHHEPVSINIYLHGDLTRENSINLICGSPDIASEGVEGQSMECKANDHPSPDMEESEDFFEDSQTDAVVETQVLSSPLVCDIRERKETCGF